jgi:hypothetical protein
VVVIVVVVAAVVVGDVNADEVGCAGVSVVGMDMTVRNDCSWALQVLVHSGNRGDARVGACFVRACTRVG